MTRLCYLIVVTCAWLGVCVQTSPAHALAPVRTCHGQAATLVGTPGADHLRGTSGDDVIVALGGEDRIQGAGGQDTICGGSGDDLIQVADNSWVSGGTGDDTIVTEGGLDQTVSGGGGDDVILDPGGFDTAQGPLPLGMVKAGPGRDQVDITVARVLTPADVVSGGSGHDVVNLMTAGPPSGPVTANLEAGTLSEAEITIPLTSFADIRVHTHGSPEVTLIGDGGPNLLEVTRQPGPSRPTTLLRGRGGDDILFGGRGNDRLEGGTGHDRGDGYAGQNTCVSVEVHRDCTQG